ncbi:unnamed protein product, partial [Notodromas monacha]
DASLLLEALASMNAICGVESPEQLSEDTYSRLESKLRLRSISTPDLILKYYHTRRENAADATVVTGLITVQACRTATGVFVYVLNGRGMQGHGRDRSEDMRKVRRGSGTMLAPPLLTSSPGSSMRKSGKDPHISTRKIVNAMAEIMKSVCDSPTGRIGSFSATGDESMPGAMTCESVEDDSKTSGYDTNETYSDTSSESGQTIPSDPDKLRNMLTSTRRSLTLLMESGVEQLDGKLTRLRRAVVNKLVESLMVSLQECCKNSASTGSLLLDRALTRIDNSLSCLHSNVPDSICRDFLDQVWASYLVSAEILADKFPNDASLLLEALASMNAICGVESPEQLSEDTYSRLESKLRLRSISTPDLILKYYHTRRKNAADATVVTGLITVQACRTATGVFVYVLNGRDMQGHGRDTPCSYISIRIFGRWCDNEESLDLNKGKTPVQKVTKTPLYEHEINLKIPEQADCKDAVLIVTANDQHHFKRNYFLGEAVLPISEISEAKENVRKYDLPQICLPLTLPGGSNEERDILNLLQSRTDDKLATEFEKKQRRRIPKLRHGMMGSYLNKQEGIEAHLGEKQRLARLSLRSWDEFREIYLNNFLVRREIGSDSLKNIRSWIIQSLESHGWDVELHSFIKSVPDVDEIMTGSKEFVNIIATRDPLACKKVVVACHYESKYFNANSEFLGAMDSAVPCALLLSISETFSPSPQESNKLLRRETVDCVDGTTLQLIFFDGEEAVKAWVDGDKLYGSTALAELWETEGKLEDIQLFILMDLLDKQEGIEAHLGEKQRLARLSLRSWDEFREIYLNNFLVRREIGSDSLKNIRSWIIQSLESHGWDVELHSFIKSVPDVDEIMTGSKEFVNIIATRDPLACKKVR